MVELDYWLWICCCFDDSTNIYNFFLIKLYFDEKRLRQSKEALRAMVIDQQHAPRNERDVVVVGGRRRQITRRRIRDDVNDDNDDGMGFVRSALNHAVGDSEQEDDELPLVKQNKDEHIGKKKLAKLQAKEERRKQREAELLEREERKQLEHQKEERLQREREQEIKKKKKNVKGNVRKERNLRETFAIDEEGFDEVDAEESQNLLREFEEYVRKAKVVNIDELGAHFNLRAEDAADRLNFLVGNGTLTGIMDDHGKFIHITSDELQAVAKFINQRGRVSRAELIEHSNKLIALESQPVKHAPEVK
ncbi:DDRGK domain-containing protein 1 [Dirofilaria immitis]|nr:DDRGK domain-containing protein 1 [Dirofilaria immitis]